MNERKKFGLKEKGYVTRLNEKSACNPIGELQNTGKKRVVKCMIKNTNGSGILAVIFENPLVLVNCFLKTILTFVIYIKTRCKSIRNV